MIEKHLIIPQLGDRLRAYKASDSYVLDVPVEVRDIFLNPEGSYNIKLVTSSGECLWIYYNPESKVITKDDFLGIWYIALTDIEWGSFEKE